MTFKSTLFLLALLSSFLLSFLLDGTWSFILWLDAVFLIGLLLLMISSGMILIEGKFFTAFIVSMRNFFVKINKREQLIRESERRTAESASFEKIFPSRKVFFQIGLLFCVVSLLLSSAIYFF